MKKLLGFIALLIFAVSITHAQNNKSDANIKTEERSVSDFSKISIQDGIDLYLRQGSSVDLTVKASEDIIDKIITEVKDNTLIIKRKEESGKRWGWNNRNNYRQAVYLTIKDLEEISSSGGSDIEAEELDLEELTIRSSGGSDIKMEIDAKRLSLSMSGGSDIDIDGSTEELVVRASGGSDLNAKNLKAVNCKVSTSGGSDVDVYASGKISMSASGASDITYSGPAEVTSKSSSGAADIRKN